MPTLPLETLKNPDQTVAPESVNASRIHSRVSPALTKTDSSWAAAVVVAACETECSPFVTVSKSFCQTPSPFGESAVSAVALAFVFVHAAFVRSSE